MPRVLGTHFCGPRWSSQLPHVGYALPIAPSVDQLSEERRRHEVAKRLHLDQARPVASLHLHEGDVLRADCDEIPRAERRSRTRD